MKPSARLSRLLKPATQKLIEFARSPEADEVEPGTAFLLLLSLRSTGSDGFIHTSGWTVGGVTMDAQVIPATHMVAEALGRVIDAEGPEIFANCDVPGWARNILVKMELLDEICEHYSSNAIDAEQPDPIDRTSPAWMQLSRRNVTLPAGLLYEAQAVRRRLAEAETPKNLSFSGMLEIALTEFLKRPVDPDDARFYDAELDDFCFEPAEDSRTISDIVSDSAIRGRRKSVKSENTRA